MDNKSNKGIIICLVVIIVLLIGVIAYLLFGREKIKELNDANSTTTTTAVVKENNIDSDDGEKDSKTYKNIAEYLSLHNIDYSSLSSLEALFVLGDNERKVYQWNDQIFKYGNFQHNNKTIYVDYNDSKSLSFSKPKERDYTDQIEEYIKVYLYNDYYILEDAEDGTDGGKFKIYDSSLNELLSDTYEGQFDLTNQALYYTTYNCENSKKEVKSYNYSTKKTNLAFYVEHTAGWKC